LTLGTVPWLIHGMYDPVASAGDGAIYIVTAGSLAAGEGYSYLGEPFVIRPPGFPVLLLPVLALAGTDFGALQLYLGAWGALGMLLLFFFYRNELGRAPALALVAVVWLNPAFREYSNRVMSDVPGLALLFACLLIERWSDSRPSPTREVVLGVAIGLSAYVRFAILLLGPAIAAARMFSRRGTKPNSGRNRAVHPALAARLLPVLILPLVIQLPWAVRNAVVEREIPVEHTLFHSYWVGMWHSDITDPESPTITWEQFTRRVERRIPKVLEALDGRMHSEKPGWLYPIPALGAIACWLFVLMRRRRSVDFSMGGLLLLLLAHFAFAPRLALPLYVHLLACVTHALRLAFGAALGDRRGELVAALPLLLIVLIDFEPRANWDEIAQRHEKTERIARFVERNTTLDNRIGAGRGLGHFLTLSLQRPVYTLRTGAWHGGVQRALDLIESHCLDTLVLDTEEPSGKQLLPVLSERYGCESIGAETACLLRIPHQCPESEARHAH
jgi:hypothetical protein